MYRAGKRLIYALWVAVVVFGGTMLLSGWQWPMTNFDIDTSFGEPENASVSPGLRLSSDSNEVVSAEDGELVFTARASRSPDSIPYTLGDFVVLEHEGGFRSLYADLERRPDIDNPVLEAGATLGTLGRSTPRGGGNLGFRVIDVRREAYVNPRSILPELDDVTAPRIEEVELFRGGQRIWSSSMADAETQAVREGQAKLRARIYDEGENLYRDEVPPHSVTVLMNGQQEFSVSLETLSLHNGEVRFGGTRMGTDLYGPDGRIRLGTYEITPRTNLFEIIALDHAGNERVVSFEILGEGEQ